MNPADRIERDDVLVRDHHRLARYLEGCYLTAALASFQRRSVLPHLLKDGISLGRLRSIAECPQKTTGNLVGTLESLQLFGLVSVHGLGEAMHALPTIVGMRLFEQAARHSEALRAADGCIAAMGQLARAFTRGTIAPEDVGKLASVVETASQAWGLGPADEDLRWLLDGVVIGPVMQMLLSPMFEEGAAGIREIAPPILEGDVLAVERRSPLAGELLRPAIEFLQRAGILAGDRCSAVGRSLAANLVARFVVFAELSYLPTFARLDQLLFGDIDQADVSGDAGCDRLMNIYGTSVLSTQAYLKEPAMVRFEFDERPLDEQVYGLVELGCGEGKTLRSLVEHIHQRTMRGQHRKDFPLVVIATDFSDVAVARAREVLEPLKKENGVDVFTFQADITKPDVLAARIEELAIKVVDRKTRKERNARAEDFLMCSNAIVQERALLIDSEASAIAFFSRFVERRDAGYRAVARELRIAEPTVQDITSAFRQNYSIAGRYVPGFVVGADLAAFFERWRPYAARGLFFCDGWDSNLKPSPALAPPQALTSMIYSRVFLESVFTTHYLSSQILTFSREFELGALVAGFRREETVTGNTIFRSLE